MMRAGKGEYGYVRSQRVKRIIRMVIFWIIDFAIFAVGMYLNQGDRKNIYTIIAALGCIPGAMATVSVIMIFRCRQMEAALHEEIEKHIGKVPVLYEMYITTYDKNLFIDAIVVCGETVACFTANDVGKSDLMFFEEHIRKQIASGGYRTQVKIFTPQYKKAFIDRLDQLAARKEDLEMERDWLVLQIIRQISL